MSESYEYYIERLGLLRDRESSLLLQLRSVRLEKVHTWCSLTHLLGQSFRPDDPLLAPNEFGRLSSELDGLQTLTKPL